MKKLRRANCGLSPIYIGCLPRSGSTLFRNMLDSHPKLAADKELFWPKTPDPAATLESSYKKVARKGQRLIIKDPGIVRIDYLPLLRDLLGNDFYFILIKRNPYDSLISYAKTNTTKNFIDYAHKFIPAYKWIHKNNWHANKFMEIKYEDLVEYPEKTLRQVCNFIKIDFNKNMLQHHTKNRNSIMINHHSDLEAKKPLFKRSINQFDSYCKRTKFKPTKAQLSYCKAMANILGYDVKDIL